MGSFKIPYSEIEAYSRINGVPVQWWEAWLLREMSEEFMLFEQQRMANKQSVGTGKKAVKGLTPMSDTKGILSLFKRVAERPLNKPTKPKATKDVEK